MVVYSKILVDFLNKKFPYYPVISGSSKSKKIIIQISGFLKQNEIKHSICLNQKLYGLENLGKWMKIIGFINSKYLRIIEKIKIAREGFEPSTFNQ